ncbi:MULTISPECIES: hypothetical protein [unclassified Mesorhizobium]|jgi:hypothetical protein|uniref:hypothetical protein n=1 Tax=unclassified Mesorhizobium TaxID=325217 RepID=UPI000FE41CCC|nr:MULTISPECIES: hypothetical protein [unclassified Mesorhizobium]MDG4894820.1 hypothetical protein [Mesorhizobium sp. WSM4976]RWH75597.1 MAG: hypothetical protein EOQ84_01210 [Mesorhizobium sp.]RWL31975.1 MAG: hypothetical protein EOR58_05215 [Mesorhizobium sp.]RWL33345.1 MAG: hypothetical protein EOR63_10030 [Mesorhizobium sp.]RWL39588.1 MAG: hypothetical protein EOR59_07705 [Mesorhizobium sp.]
MNGDKWFRPKRHGYGATPDNWKGWAFVVALILIAAALSVGLINLGAPAWLIILVVIALTGATIPLIKAKTDGDWRWRWH